MPLPLNVPSERGTPPKDLEIRPKQAKAWIDSLPLGQGVDVSRKVLAAVTALNRSKVDLEDRIQILEAYRAPSRTLIEELEAMCARSTLPLPTRAREALDLARSLASELSIGYRIAVNEKAGKLIAFGARKALPQLVHRAMEYVGDILRTSYKAYSPVPSGTWQLLHRLYCYAEEEGFLAEAVDPSKGTIADLYCEMLLLALTDPYRLNPGEADKVLALVRSSPGGATIATRRPASAPGGHFIVPLDGDQPPKPALTSKDGALEAGTRLLDANLIVDKVRLRKQAYESGNVSATTSKLIGPDGLALLGKLVVLWGDPPKRAFRRNPMEATVAICVGLKAVGHFVFQEPVPDAGSEAATIRSGITVPLIAIPDDDLSRSLGVSEWDVVNQSAGGLRVRRSGAIGQPFGVGDVVGIKLIGRPRWTIGVARWITVLEEGGLEFGIQFLAPMARAVALQPTISAAGAEAKLALRLCAVEGDGESAGTLLTSPSTFSDLREFEVEEDGMVSLVRATNLIEKTGRFELFQVSPS